MKKTTQLCFPLGLFCTLSIAARASDEGLVAWWDFEQTKDNTTVDKIARAEDSIEGSFTSVAGVVGSALRLDGLTTCILRPANRAPELGAQFTIEAWIALAAYPWNWCPVVSQSRDNESGYFFSVGPRGQATLQMAAGGGWHSCTSGDFSIPLRRWTHVAGVFDGKTLSVYVNGETPPPVTVAGSPAYARDVPLRIGANHVKRKPSHIHREHGTLPGWFSLDGLVDEIKLYRRARTDAEIRASLARKSDVAPELPPRIMPSGPPGPGRFGAYYTTLAYYPEWDALWRVGPDSDVLVRFDASAARLVFWRGSRYSPAWVSENGLWMADQSVEAWGVGKNDKEGCFEHMQDRRCRYSHVRVIETHEARAVVHWRYAPVSSHDHLWRVDEKTGRACWVDEYYTVYPDLTAVRKVSWKTGTLGRPRQFQESLPFTQPGQLQGDVIHKDFAFVANLKGESQVLSFVKDPRESEKRFPPDLTIQLYNFKSVYKPFIVFEPGNRMHYVKDRRLGSRGLRVPGACNHWPVGQAACDGRTVQAADRPTHFLGFPISDPPVHEKDGRSWWNGLYGMTSASIAELVAVARSWSQPPGLSLKTTGFTSQGYDRGERAYLLACTDPENTPVLEGAFAATEASPLVNPALVVKRWGEQGIQLELDGVKAVPGKDFRVGHRHRVEGSDLVVWIRRASVKPVTIRLLRGFEAER